MDSSQIILWMIAICVSFIFYVILSKQIKSLVKLIVQGLMGMLGIYFVNFLTAPLGASVGLNFMTWLITGILGLPGGALLYATAFLLR